MKKERITPYRICKDNKIPHASFMQIKKGSQEFKVQQLVDIAKYFNVDLEYLVFGKSQSNVYLNDNSIDDKNKTIKVQLFGGKGVNYIEIINEKDYVKPFFIIAKGDAMEPYIFQGDILLCDESKIKVIEGNIAVAKLHDSQLPSNANLIHHLDEKHFILSFMNPKYKPIIVLKNTIEKIYPVLKIIRDLK